VAYRPISATIESDLEQLADRARVEIVEHETATLLVSAPALWRTLDSGSEIEIAMGLIGIGSDDYGLFRVDEAELVRGDNSERTQITARDMASLLLEGRSTQDYRYGLYGESPSEPSFPSAQSVVESICGLAGLDLIWDADDVGYSQFAISAGETLADALARALSPMRISRRYRVDSWVTGNTLVVRTRGRGKNKGALDCLLGKTSRLKRTQATQWGTIDVYGASYTNYTAYETEDETTAVATTETAEGAPASVEIVDAGNGIRTVKTYITQEPRWDYGSGFTPGSVLASTETETITYRDVHEGETPGGTNPLLPTSYRGAWLGRVPIKAVTVIEANLHQPASKTVTRKTVTYGYDTDWKLILEDERTLEYQPDGSSKGGVHSVVRTEQATPTTIKVTTWEYKVATDGSEKAQKGFPKRVMQPGVMTSAIKEKGDPNGTWQPSQVPQTAPSATKKRETTGQYHAEGSGPGAIPFSASDSNWQNNACSLIAEQIEAEAGAWRYELQIDWPRPFPYRKGDIVTLSNIPGGLSTATAVVISVNSRYGTDRWSHDVRLEWWEDA
jgi:hypothetical protein